MAENQVLREFYFVSETDITEMAWKFSLATMSSLHSEKKKNQQRFSGKFQFESEECLNRFVHRAEGMLHALAHADKKRQYLNTMSKVCTERGKYLLMMCVAGSEQAAEFYDNMTREAKDKTSVSEDPSA